MISVASQTSTLPSFQLLTEANCEPSADLDTKRCGRVVTVSSHHGHVCCKYVMLWVCKGCACGVFGGWMRITMRLS